MASRNSVTSGNPNGHRSANQGPSESGAEDKFKEVIEACERVEAKWEEERQRQQSTIRTLQEQVMEHERGAAEQKTLIAELQAEISVKERMLEEQQRRWQEREVEHQREQTRIRDLEGCLVEEQRRVAELTARNATLAQVTESLQAPFAIYAKLMNSNGAIDNPLAPAQAHAALPAVVAAEVHHVTVADDIPQSATAPRPELPAGTVAAQVAVDTAMAAVAPLPVADDAASSVDGSLSADGDLPLTLFLDPPPQRTVPPPAYHSILLLPAERTLLQRLNGCIESEYPAPPGPARPPKTVRFAALPSPVAGGSKRKRSASVLTAGTCGVCSVTFADAAELRQHACPLQCAVEGCGKTFSTESARQRHEKGHFSPLKRGSAHASR
ncbi:uncharacterized protein LOC129592454 [Paramacrobiotus metropolitanus]|uniref:uncharacterized protein LOC129592454 n=1 Tax=Paramacrobiotus metropolitanus TaxID=2943436 RepID=UPI002445C027|nr:uncharacterized protein LOC129592454 [Paramacrobiotus metropolitanus]